MKKKIGKIIFIILFLFLTSMACSNKSLAMETNVTITKGESKQINTTEQYYIWTGYSVSDSSIVSIKYNTVYDGRGGVTGVNNLVVTALKEGTCTITCSGKFSARGYTAAASKAITIKVVKSQEEQQQEKVEEVEEKIEELDTYYTKDINEIKSGDYYEKSKYIKSILINDEKNGNFNLWNKFVKETTPEERKAWEAEISKHVRGEGVEASARDALGDQIRLDEGKITQEEFEEEIKGEQEQQKEYYLELKELKSQIIGERLPSEFKDILDNIDGYDKPDDLDSGTSNKIGAAANKVLTAIMNIGMVAAVLMIAILGIKYMLGSVEEKAEYKKDIIPYLIGACLLFGITTFVKIFMQFGQAISNL